MDIPDNDFFLQYGPDYRLPVLKGYQRDTNSKAYIDNIVKCVNGNYSINVINNLLIVKVFLFVSENLDKYVTKL